jgi:hypothetical protein
MDDSDSDDVHDDTDDSHSEPLDEDVQDGVPVLSHGIGDVDTKSSAVIDSHEQSQAVIIDSHHQLSPSSTVTDSHEQSSAEDTDSVLQPRAILKKELPPPVVTVRPIALPVDIKRSPQGVIQQSCAVRSFCGARRGGACH